MYRIIAVLMTCIICAASDAAGQNHSYNGYPKSTAECVAITNTGFTIGYSESHRNPLWVAYRLFPVNDPVSPKRPSKFKVDKRTEAQVKHDDYTHSGYDRGHMAPNYGIATRYGKEAQLETFLMSNICPQLPNLNRRVWKDLEMKVAKEYANQFEEIWIVTGPIFDDDHEYLESGVEIPDAFYKIIVDELNGSPRMLAFIMGQVVQGSEPLLHFVVSIDSIESVTGIDFFWELEDTVEDCLEAVVPSNIW